MTTTRKQIEELGDTLANVRTMHETDAVGEIQNEHKTHGNKFQTFDLLKLRSPYLWTNGKRIPRRVRNLNLSEEAWEGLLKLAPPKYTSSVVDLAVRILNVLVTDAPIDDVIRAIERVNAPQKMKAGLLKLYIGLAKLESSDE